MHLAFDIFQGLGISAAVGIRPFLPALAVGALAAAGVQISFAHTDFVFLQEAAFLFALAVATVALGLVERRFGDYQSARGPLLFLVLGLSLAIGALLFAGALAQNRYPVWGGILGGVVCAALGAVAVGPLLRRVRARLDAQSAASALPLFAEAGAVLAAVLSVVAPPVGPIVVLALVWLLVASRRREGKKYAGLRILR